MTMPTEMQRRADLFYDEVIRRVQAEACNSWAHVLGDISEGAEGPRLVLMPAHLRIHEVAHWPQLGNQPLFLLDREAVMDAFTRILKLTSDIDSGLYRYALHLAEQEGDASKLHDQHIDFVVQIAVFGRLIYDTRR